MADDDGNTSFSRGQSGIGRGKIHCCRSPFTMAPPNEEHITAVMEVLPHGPDARATAVSLLERARANDGSAGSGSSDGGNDIVSAALNLFFSAAATPAAGANTPSTLQSASTSKANATLSPAPVFVSAKASSPASKLSPAQSTTTSRVVTGTKRPRSADSSDHSKYAKRQAPETSSTGPLAERVRPATLDDLIGQNAFSPDSSLGMLLMEDRFPSTILWGPPGSGKTTIAHIVAKATKRRVHMLSATSAGVKEVRSIVEEATRRRQLNPYTGSFLFLDEVHRWNKTQQDALLPHVESGLITLCGATTENPSFSLNKALLSRCRVITLNALDTNAISEILRLALSNPRSGLSQNVQVSDDVLKGLAAIANGDARMALNALEIAIDMSKQTYVGDKDGTDGSAEGPIVVSASTVEKALQRKSLLYDRGGEEHYNIISALHKSMRAGDVDASLYWLARMLEAGEDARYVARRLVRFASEDIGLADPNALLQATAAHRAAEKVGMPECDVILAQATAYLARAPKSVAVYSAYKAAKQLVQDGPADPVPLHIRNAPTGLMKDLGYGKDYKYNPQHGYKRGCAEGLSLLPQRLAGTGTCLFREDDVESGHSLYPFDQKEGSTGRSTSSLVGMPTL